MAGPLVPAPHPQAHPFTHPAGGLKDVVDQAAERLQKKRKASVMPTSPFASPAAAHQAPADRQASASRSLAAVRAAWGSLAAQGKDQQAGDDCTHRQTGSG